MMEVSRHLQIFLMTLYITSCIHVSNSSNIGRTRHDITLSSEGGYGNLLVVIDDAVDEDLGLLDKLQTYLTATSTFLHTATENQVYMENITILVPSSWEPNATWGVAEGESVDTARIVVAPPNLAWGDTPYTLQPGQCGEEGDYIHLTPDWVKNVSTNMEYPEKKLVREFAHLKWGVFDEDTPTGNTETLHLYFHDGSLYPTDSRCISILGDERTTTSVSLLNDEQLDAAVGFGSPGDHNVNSLSKQNQFCNQKSAWQVMIGLPDFATDYEIVREGGVPPPPTFTVIQKKDDLLSTPDSPNTEVSCQQDVICLLLDVSTSMKSYNRIGKMTSAVSNYILAQLQLGTAVGIVEFNSSSRILADITQLNTTKDRVDLTMALPTTPLGGTGIGGGLNLCRKELQRYAGADVDKTRIVLLSDGKENNYPKVHKVLPTIIQLGITVDTILYSQNADSVLLNAAKETGGKSYMANDKNSEVILNMYLAEIAEQGCSQNRVMVLNKGVQIKNSANEFTDGVKFDKTIGVNNVFTFAYKNGIHVEIDPKFGCHTNLTTHSEQKLVYVEVICDKSGGEVEYNITKSNHTKEEKVVVTVTSQLVPGVLPITVKPRVSSDVIDCGKNSMLNIFVDIFQGHNPVLGLEVVITVEIPKGVYIRLNAADSGTGMDSTANDGVYTATMYSHLFKGNGYYRIQVNVAGEGRLPSQKGCEHCTGISLGTVMRTLAGGVVSVTNHASASDQTPPERIRDLVVVSVVNKTVFTLQWTAPGDDINNGTASGYNIYGSSSFFVSTYQRLPSNHKAILTDMEDLLVPAGRKVELRLNYDQLGQRVKYIRISAVDDAGNEAEYSNHVFVTAVDSTPPHPSADEINEAGGGTPCGAIVGALIGCLLFIGLLIVVAIFCFRRHKHPSKESCCVMLCCPCCMRRKKDDERDEELQDKEEEEAKVC